MTKSTGQKSGGGESAEKIYVSRHMQKTWKECSHHQTLHGNEVVPYRHKLIQIFVVRQDYLLDHPTASQKNCNFDTQWYVMFKLNMGEEKGSKARAVGSLSRLIWLQLSALFHGHQTSSSAMRRSTSSQSRKLLQLTWLAPLNTDSRSVTSTAAAQSNAPPLMSAAVIRPVNCTQTISWCIVFHLLTI